MTRHTWIQTLLVTSIALISSMGGPIALADSRDEDVQPDPPTRTDLPESFTLRSVAFAGSGCAAGTVHIDAPADPTGLQVEMRAMRAEVGPGVGLPESRKNCQLNLSFAYPLEWSYAVTSVRYRSHAQLDAGVSALQKIAIYYAGEAQTSEASSSFVGPLDAVYDQEVAIAPEAQVWSPCGVERSLNINAQVRLTASEDGARGVIANIDEEGRTTQEYRFSWRRCSP